MQSHRVPWLTLAAYSSLAFPLAAAFLTLQVIIPTFYAQITSMSLSVIGFVLLGARLWDTFTDPVIGYLSDKTPQQYGRRKIWIISSIPLICLSIWALFNPPTDAGVGYLLAWTLAIYIFGTMAIVPMNAWGAELSPDYHERSRITGARVAFGMIGTLTALVVVAIASGGSNSETTAMQETLWILTVLIIVTFIIAAFCIGFGVADNKSVKVPQASFKSALSLLKKPSPFRTLIVSFLINSTGSAIPATLFLLYVTHVMQMADKVGLFLFIYFICAAVAVPFWVMLSKHYGKHRTWSSAMLVGCAFFVCIPFVGANDFIFFTIIVIGTGIATGADLALPSAINGDLIEWDALENGHKRPGIFFALWGTTTKLAYALAVGISFPLLELFGFSANGINSDSALTALAWMYSIPCVVCKLTAVYLMFNYPITQQVHENIRQQLNEKNM